MDNEIEEELNESEEILNEETWEGELTPKQQLFCEFYAGNREFFGNGVQSYLEAYNPKRTGAFWYDAAAASASRLLRNVKIVKEINKQLEINGLNDQAVDKQLAFVIAQHSDFNSKVAAIKEYNKLKQRIIIKTDITSGGKAIQGNTIVFSDFKADETES